MIRIGREKHVFVGVLPVVFSSACVSEEKSAMITAGNTVGLQYTLKLAGGTVVDSNVDGDPFGYIHGSESLFPTLEAALAGMVVDEEKTVNLEAADAYGPVNPDAFREVPIAEIPEAARAVGAQLRAEGFNAPIRVHEIREETILLNFNNPLAGESLTFDIRVLSIQ